MVKTVHLQIKLKTLVAESRIIKTEEERWKERAAKARAKLRKWDRIDAVRNSLHAHRQNDVRKESRCGYLAYGFLRGRPYQVVENAAKRKPDWKRVEEITKRFSEIQWNELGQKFAEWKDSAEAVLTGKAEQPISASVG